MERLKRLLIVEKRIQKPIKEWQFWVNVTYDPNHLVNDGKPVELDWWLWDAPELFGSIAKEYEKIHPNVKINIINNPWDGFWTKLPLALQKGANVLLQVLRQVLSKVK